MADIDDQDDAQKSQPIYVIYPAECPEVHPRNRLREVHEEIKALGLETSGEDTVQGIREDRDSH